MEVAESLPVPADWILQGGAVGLLGLVALMVFMGWLIPRGTYRALERDRDYWRAAALKSLGQTEALMPVAQITTEVTKHLAGSLAGEVSRALGDRADGAAPAAQGGRVS